MLLSHDEHNFPCFIIPLQHPASRSPSAISSQVCEKCHRGANSEFFLLHYAHCNAPAMSAAMPGFLCPSHGQLVTCHSGDQEVCAVSQGFLPRKLHDNRFGVVTWCTLYLEVTVAQNLSDGEESSRGRGQGAVFSIFNHHEV